MRQHLHLHVLLADTRARFAMIVLFALVGSALFLSLFTSPAVTLALVGGVGILALAWWRPHTLLLGLLAYLPFEPFLLKWIPDDVYVLARYSSELVIYMLAASVFLRMVWEEKRWKRSVLDVPFVFFLLAILASIVVNMVDPTVALLGARQLLRFIILFFIVVQLAPSKQWMKSCITMLVTVAGIQAAIGGLQALSGGALDTFLLPSERRTLGTIQLTEGTDQFWDPGQRVFATMGRYDQLGIFLALVLLVIIAFLYDERLGKKPKMIAAGVLVLPVLVLTYSRSAWFGFVFGFLFFAIALKKDRRVMWAAAITPLIITAYIFGNSLIVNTLTDTPEQTIAERFFEAFSYERWRGEYVGYGRLYWMVETVLTVVPSSPVFGVGPGQYGGGAAAALGNTLVYDRLSLPFGVYGTGGYIDNNWMSIWGELGIIGLGAFVWMYITLFLWCVKTAREHPDKDIRALAGATAAVLVAFSLNAFLATFFEVRTMAPYVWVLCGLVASRVKSDDEKETGSRV
jgi:O-Antigen ligase